ARRLAEPYTLCFARASVDAIIWHGSWAGDANAPGGGLLRRDFSPKPAYRVLHKLIHMYWHTRATGLSDGDGCFRFRGFWGTYRVGVAAAAGGTTVTSFCHLPPVRAC